MQFKVIHLTKYAYNKPVQLSYNETRLTPRTFFGQTCLSSHLHIHPHPDETRKRTDIYGNTVYYFAVHHYHNELSVKSISEVDLHLQTLDNQPALSESWEITAQKMIADHQEENLFARQFTLNSPHVPITHELIDYARPSFSKNRPILAAARDIMNRIYHDFKFVNGVTHVATSLSELLQERCGVCQDFAHLAIGCLRAMGLAARYVSGYLETLPPPGKVKLIGADASHAWVSLFIPDYGWIDFDPTNNILPVDSHITLAWGRDFSDVTPLKGVIYGGGNTTLTVAVDVNRL